MTLAPGTRLGIFEILDLAGKGGMGEVYRARDTRLNREVAIKVLPEAFARDPERLARFEREAQLLAALNHPNIAAIYGLQHQDDVHCLVMEYVPGESLRGPLKVAEALRIARQMAEGLEEAHAKNIVHRDLKPANIRITPEGKVKILDFGLAKALGAPAPSESDSTMTVGLGETREGTIMGTPPYMSPEQARGEKTDHRTDIWAFGCVLYEVLTGKRAFEGKTTVDTLAAVVNATPKWAALPESTPAPLRQVLEWCLEKDASRRLQSMADARVLLDRTPGLMAETMVPRRRSAGSWLASAVVILALVSAGLLWQAWRKPSEAVWSGTQLGGSEVALGPRISPDGQFLAFLAMVDGLTQVAVMKPDSGNWQVLTHDRSRGLVTNIAWSLDGTKLYFDREGSKHVGIFSVPVLGGGERLVVEDAYQPQVLPDGSLVMARLDSEGRNQLHRFWPESGRVQPLNALIRGSIDGSLRTAPGGQVVFWGTPRDQANTPDHLYALEPNSQKIVRLAPGVTFVQKFPLPLAISADGKSALAEVPSGDLHRIASIPLDGSADLRTLFTLTTTTGYLDVAKDGTVYADQWDRPDEVMRLSGSGTVLERIGTATGNTFFGGSLALPDGRVVFPARSANRERLMVAGKGKEPAVFIQTEEETAGPMAMVGGTQMAFLMGARGPDQTIAIASISDGRITLRINGVRGASKIITMVSSPDGKTMYYTSAGKLWAIPTGDGKPQDLRAGDFVTVDPYRGDLIVLVAEKAGFSLVRVPLAGGGEQTIHVEGDARLVWGNLHPQAVAKDGRILVPATLSSSWFGLSGVLDPKTGHIAIVRTGYDADFELGWSPDGNIVGVVSPLRSSLWRFRKE